MGTKNNPGDFDCYENAAPDEPIFTLKATDPSAPNLLRRWANQYRNRKAEVGKYGPDEKEKFEEAKGCAAAMEKWRKENIE